MRAVANGRYPADFIRRVRRMYPNSITLHKMLTAGMGSGVRTYLDTMCRRGVPSGAILTFIDTGRIGELRAVAARQVAQVLLLEECIRIQEEWD
jgi:hypothetical protein